MARCPLLPDNVDLDGIKLHVEFRTRAKGGMPRKELLEEARSSGGKKSLDDFASIFFGGERRSYEATRQRPTLLTTWSSP